MHCECTTEEEFIETLAALAQTVVAFATLNEVCPKTMHMALAVLANDPAVKPYLQEADVWATQQEALAQPAASPARH